MTPHPEKHDSAESPTAKRILAIDDEIAALERAMPKARVIVNGTAVIAFCVLAGAIFIAGTDSDVSQYLRYILPSLGLIAVPGGILAIQMLKMRRERLALERELDALLGGSKTAEPSRGRWTGEPSTESRDRPSP
jgi:hypothetical protein